MKCDCLAISPKTTEFASKFLECSKFELGKLKRSVRDLLSRYNSGRSGIKMGFFLCMEQNILWEPQEASCSRYMGI